MTQSKHTPGPWEISEVKTDGYYGGGPSPRQGYTSFQIVDPKGKVIADLTNTDVAVINDYDFHTPIDEQGLANARLIVTAPDLLAYAECEEALNSGNLEKAEDVFERHGWRPGGITRAEFTKNLRAEAIAKAEVRS